MVVFVVWCDDTSGGHKVVWLALGFWELSSDFSWNGSAPSIPFPLFAGHGSWLGSHLFLALFVCLRLFPGISSQALKAFLSPPSSFTSCRRCHQISTAPLHALKIVGGWIQWYRLVLENEKDVLVMFFAPWCGCLTSRKRWEGSGWFLNIFPWNQYQSMENTKWAKASPNECSRASTSLPDGQEQQRALR